MTPDQIARVRASWALIVPVADTVAAQFYDRLFTIDPSLRVLFAATDPSTQRRKLMQTLAVVVAGLDQLSDLLPAVEALARRHVGYGVSDAHYDTVGAALLWAFDRALGDDFDDRTRDAWVAAYTRLAAAMRDAVAIAGSARHR